MMLALMFGIPLWAFIMSAVVILGLFALIELEKPGLATITVLGTLIALQFVAGVDILGGVVAHPIVTAACVLSYFVGGVVWAFVKWWFYVRNEQDRYDTKKVEFLKFHHVNGTTVPDKLKEIFLAAFCPNEYENARRSFINTHPEFEEFEEFEKNETFISPEQQAEWRRVFNKENDDHFSLHSRINYISESKLSDDLKTEFLELLAGPQFKKALITSTDNNMTRIMMWMTWWPWSALWTLINDPIKRAFLALFQALKARFQKMSEYAFRNIDDDLVKTEDPK